MQNHNHVGVGYLDTFFQQTDFVLNLFAASAWIYRNWAKTKHISVVLPTT